MIIASGNELEGGGGVKKIRGVGKVRCRKSREREGSWEGVILFVTV